jgi:hypothetical protein
LLLHFPVPFVFSCCATRDDHFDAPTFFMLLGCGFHSRTRHPSGFKRCRSARIVAAAMGSALGAFRAPEDRWYPAVSKGCV